MVKPWESDVRLAVQPVQELTAQDRAAIAELGKGDLDVHPMLRQLQWAEPRWRVILRIGGEIVSGIALVDRVVQVGEERILVVGVGDVATLPAWRRKGLAGRCLEAATAFMRDETEGEFGHLFCADRLVPYYARHGWEVVRGPSLVQAPWGTEVFPEETMILALRGRPWPAGIIDLEGLPW